MTHDEEVAYVTKLMPLARQMALRFIKNYPRFTLDEAMSHACEGVLEAVRGEPRGVDGKIHTSSLKIFAARKAHWRMIDAYRVAYGTRSGKTARLRLVKNPVQIESLPDRLLDRIVCQREEPCAKLDTADWLGWLMQGCDNQQRVLVRRCVLNDEPLWCAAKELKCSVATCSVLLRVTLRKLRRKLTRGVAA